MSEVSFTPRELEGMEVYDLLTNLVVPRPIAFVSSVSADGVPNMAPFSYFNIGGSNPASVVFSPGTLPGGMGKDTLRNIEETREYVINLVTAEVVTGMNETSPNFPPEINEWEMSGLTPVDSDVVKVQRVKECLASFECRLFEVVAHGDGPGSANYVIGEVVKIHAQQAALDDLENFPAVSRLGGPHYLDLGSLKRFSLERPGSS